MGRARLRNPDGNDTLSLRQAMVKGSVRLVDSFSEGRVMLNRCVIEGRLDLRGGNFNCPASSVRNANDEAIEAISTVARGGLYLGWRRAEPSVDFTGAASPILADNPSTWPSHFHISGMSYDRFEDPTGGDADGVNLWDWDARVTWLCQQKTFDSGPYEQAARVFRQHGYKLEAENILISQRRDAQRADRLRRASTPLRRRLSGVVVGRVF